MQNNIDGMIVFPISLRLCKDLCFHPEIKVILVHAAHLSPLYTRTLQAPMKECSVSFLTFFTVLANGHLNVHNHSWCKSGLKN